MYICPKNNYSDGINPSVDKKDPATGSLLPIYCFETSVIGDNGVTSSIKIEQVFPDLVGKKTRALWKVYGGMLKYVINYALYLAHYMHIFI